MSDYNRVICPICSGVDFDSLSGFPTPAVRCKGCRLGIECQTSLDPAGDYDRKKYDATTTTDAGIGMDRWRRFHHDSAVAVQRFIQLAGVLPQARAERPRSWVDVGANNGAVLVAARRQGWLVTGVEADNKTADELSKVHGLPVLDYRSWMSLAPTRPSADAVSFFDVIEHVLDFPGTILAAAASLRPDGVIVIEVPDLDSAECFLNWKHRKITDTFTEHLYHFSEASLDTLRAKYASDTRTVRVARPVPGKIQVVWRKAA